MNMRIAISGSVGVGKTTISKQLAKKLQLECIHLNEIAEQFKIKDHKELQTFDFDVKACLEYVEEKYKNSDVLFEGHFAHLLDPEFVDFLIVINRDLKELKEEYKIRGYNQIKIKENLEVESFNVCFYEAEEEGYEEKQIIVVENTQEEDVEEVVLELYYEIKKRRRGMKK